MPKFEREVDIDAPVGVVWSIMSDASRWPQWFWATDSITGLTGVAPGGTFSWVNGDDSGTGTIANVVPNEMIHVITQWENNQADHYFHVKADSGGLFGRNANKSWFTYTMEYGSAGGFLGNIVTGGNPLDLRRVKETTDKMKDLAERQSGG
jgi:uncharacterized protein YndB with AHSA1/START domain